MRIRKSSAMSAKDCNLILEWSFSSSPVFSGGGTQQRATCWICASWCFGSPTTVQGPWRWVACWLTAGEQWGGSWAAMSCWSPVNMLFCAALLTTGTTLPQRGQVKPAPSHCLSGRCWWILIHNLNHLIWIMNSQPAAAGRRCLVTCWRSTAPDWWWWNRWRPLTPPLQTPSSSWRKLKERDMRWCCIRSVRHCSVWRIGATESDQAEDYVHVVTGCWPPACESMKKILLVPLNAS